MVVKHGNWPPGPSGGFFIFLEYLEGSFYIIVDDSI